MDEIERLAERLRPLMPDRVERWLQARHTGDGELAALIDRQVRETLARTLKGVDPPLLLSLPGVREVGGPIQLGTVVYAGDRHTAGLKPEELLNHLCILGRSGAGKTNATFNVILQLSDRRIPWVFLDVKRTARHLSPLLGERGGGLEVYTAGRPVRPLAFSPFTPPRNIEPSVYAGYAVDLLARAFTLGAGSISVLHKALLELQSRGVAAPSTEELLREMDSHPATGRAAGWVTSARRALESVSSALPRAPSDDQARFIQGLTSGRTVIELDGLNPHVRNFVAPLICLWLYLNRLGSNRREHLDLVLVIEEAQNFLPRAPPHSSGSVMDMILRQSRELGMGVIVVAQHPHLLSSAALNNSFATLALNLKDAPDINRAATILGLEGADRGALAQLPVGFAIVKYQDRCRRPFLIRIPEIGVRKGSVTDAMLENRTIVSGIGGRHHDAHDHPSPRPRTSDDSRALSGRLLAEDSVRFIEDVLQFPDDGVKARYSRLEVSGDKGNRLKNELVRGGWLDMESVRVGTSRKVLLRLSRTGRAYVGLDAHPVGTGGLAHEYWRRKWADALKDKGYTVRLEAPRNGGALDILASRGAERLAVEIESGKSSAVHNVRRCLKARVSKVVVAVTNSAAFERIQRDLAEHQLLVPGRVEVRLAWDLGIG